MRIARDLLDQIVEHARRDAPNECCGLVSVRDGSAVGVHPLENTAASPLRFDTGVDLGVALEAIEDAGAGVGAIYHSHTRSEPYPSQTDINWSRPWWEDVEWLIVGLHGAEPEVRSFFIKGGEVREVDVEVE
jgi:proteasome lid subunit RPN8/RPN11